METRLRLFALNLLYGSGMSWRGGEGGVRERDLLIHNDNDAYDQKSATLKPHNITQTRLFTFLVIEGNKRNGSTYHIGIEAC